MGSKMMSIKSEKHMSKGEIRRSCQMTTQTPSLEDSNCRLHHSDYEYVILLLV